MSMRPIALWDHCSFIARENSWRGRMHVTRALRPDPSKLGDRLPDGNAPGGDARGGSNSPAWPPAAGAWRVFLPKRRQALPNT